MALKRYSLSAMKQKSILTIQDYSCLGRCSLTVATPTISASGIQAIGLPTGLLSNHTAFPSWTYLDCMPSLMEAPEKWGELTPNIDAIYTGYLSTEQVDMALSLIKRLKQEESILFVDPAFADQGALYPGFSSAHIEAMKKLLEKADMAKPNITEACFLTGSEYKPGMSEQECEALIIKFAKLGPKSIVLSGLEKNGQIGCMIYQNGKTSVIYKQKVAGHAHGTGDLFSSALISSYLLGFDLARSVEIAEEYVGTALSFNLNDGVDGVIYGPEFEKAIPSFMKNLGII